MRPSIRALLPALAFLVCIPSANAHKMKVFATAQGREISGEVYYTTGGNPTDMPVLLLVPESHDAIARTKVDAEGAFQFIVKHRADYIVRADAGMGHVAETRVAASDFDASLPLLNASGTPAAAARETLAQTAVTPMAQAPSVPPAAPSGALEAKIDSLSKQVHDLRAEIDHAASRVRLQDTVAGIGYIMGIAGIALYFMSRKKGS